MNVAEYEAWRKVYDEFYGERGDMVSWAPPRFTWSTTRTTSLCGTTSRVPKWPQLSSRRTLYGTSCSAQAFKASRRSGSPLKAGGRHQASHQATRDPGLYGLRPAITARAAEG